jgi:NAD-dependent SIR2 family protein deacetylase
MKHIYETEEVICPSCKCGFKTKAEIKHYINTRNKRKGGDRFKFYYCPICGRYHLTTNTVYGENLLRKSSRKYNRLTKKKGDLVIYMSAGII